MATANDSNMTLVAILSATALTFSVHHAYKFDKCKCLLPKRKEWFRVLLTWMLLLSTASLFTWAAGWCWIKYKLKWIYIPNIGAMPYPPQLYTQKYINLNIPFMIVFNFAFSLQTSLNAEEGLYWYHLMRAVRQPKSARSWLTSSFFYAWIVISIISTTLQCCIGWIHKGTLDLTHQLSVVLTVDGLVELVVMTFASVVIWRFPAFLATVKASGAGPEVRSRLHFYHEANKVRTFFRFLFSVGMIVLGIDGLTKQRIANTPLASDLVSQVVFGSYFFILIISILLYLPRNWSPEGSQRVGVMVAGGAVHSPDHAQLASGVALMSLLREGGQWDDDIVHPKGMNDMPYNLNNHRMYSSEDPFTKDEVDWESKRESSRGIPSVLENFTSPIAVPTKEDSIPTEIRIRVEQEIHQEGGDDYV
ncbi:uncharacterized protein L203_105107 [Cryptococcus depauperatus CBS 7841]|uniref:Uncharacterized protein n=1 Tax=Cryptococcus depauperatus CBS 7841 TaxID=1295531 RepID=A0AAJ8JWU3_9TREE